jgi:hypothetical protein
MPAPNQAPLDAALAALGSTELHALPLSALLPDAAEREAVVLYIAHHLTQLDPHTAINPTAIWWASNVAAALRRRWPQAAADTPDLAGRGLVLLALAWEPATLPPAAPVPPLLATSEGEAARLQ